MFSYYFDLLNKPEYKLTVSEKMFLDAFPLLCILALAALCFIIGLVIDIFKKK